MTKSLIDRVGDVRKLWAMAIGSISEPSMDKLLHWCATYSESEIEHAFVRASNKLHKGDIVRSTCEVERYISGVMYNEAQQTKAKLAKTLARVNSGRVA
jgi:hypothetical protein